MDVLRKGRMDVVCYYYGSRMSRFGSIERYDSLGANARAGGVIWVVDWHVL